MKEETKVLEKLSENDLIKVAGGLETTPPFLGSILSKSKVKNPSFENDMSDKEKEEEEK